MISNGTILNGSAISIPVSKQGQPKKNASQDELTGVYNSCIEEVKIRKTDNPLGR
tara:strand:+ start:3051 stop:3215 length:165 start_codon:yes stop_codon:yes gene_type:complete